MAKDQKMVKFIVGINLNFVPVNQYGEVLPDQGGTLNYTITLEVKNIVELGVYLERLNVKPFEFIQMIDPPDNITESMEDPF